MEIEPGKTWVAAVGIMALAQLVTSYGQMVSASDILWYSISSGTVVAAGVLVFQGLIVPVLNDSRNGAFEEGDHAE